MKNVKKLLIILRIIADCRSPAVLSPYHFFVIIILLSSIRPEFHPSELKIPVSQKSPKI